MSDRPLVPVSVWAPRGAALPADCMGALAALLVRARAAPAGNFLCSLLALDLLDPALREQLSAGGLGIPRALEHRLVDQGLLSQLEFERVRAHMLGVPEVDGRLFVLEPAATALLPLAVARRFNVLPLGMLDGLLYVASATPLDAGLRSQLEMAANRAVRLVWAGYQQIAGRLGVEAHSLAVAPLQDRPHGATRPVESVPEDVHTLLSDALQDMRSAATPAQVNAVTESSSVIRLVNQIIRDAWQQRASDIHIETNPGDDVSRVRFRKDGDLEDYVALPVALRGALVSRIKIMSRLDISEKRRPQDGKINFHDFSDVALELRVAVLPTHDNLEDVVLRLLASTSPMPLSQLGLSARDGATVQRLCAQPFGLFLACGPTGSGKTTTLHSLLAQINTTSRKIWTAEDPIEITQKGLRQLQVNPRIGVTFASAMRAFLRADPDVIMIGEVRDAETAHVCVEASLTGHLVLSTLHTNSAAESVVRLLDLGMDPMHFGDSLVGIVAQRLVRGLCRACALPVPVDDAAWAALLAEYVAESDLPLAQAEQRLLEAAGTPPDVPGPRLYRAVGCPACAGRGLKGRTGIYEVLENSNALKRVIQTRASTADIQRAACAAGMRTLRQDALEKAVAGQIDLAQARTV